MHKSVLIYSLSSSQMHKNAGIYSLLAVRILTRRVLIGRLM